MALFAGLISLLVALTAGCQPPDCDRQDCGSCGNGCCNMMYTFDVPVKQLYDSMQKVFDGKNGPDGQYTKQPMAEGGEGFADLTPYNKSISYIGQVWHTTQTEHFNDTVDMTFSPDAVSGGSVLKIFSISQIGGAYCDDGQNYKNVVQLVKALGQKYEETTVLGCSPP